MRHSLAGAIADSHARLAGAIFTRQLLAGSPGRVTQKVVRRPCLVLLLLASAAVAEEPDWWIVERDVVGQLFTRDVGAWARALDVAAMPDAVVARMTRFQVLVRAGHARGQRRAIRALRDLAPVLQAGAIDFLIGREDREMARFAMEQWPHAPPGWGRAFFRDWAKTAKPGEVDRWLAVQAGKSRHWILTRLDFRHSLGTADELVDEQAEAVRKRPDDLDGVLFYLDVLNAARATRDLGWIANVVRPQRARDSRRLGSKLLSHAPRVGIALLERAASQPLTDEERRGLTFLLSVPSDIDIEQRFRDGVKLDLMRAYLRVGEAARSQKLLEELSARYPNGIPAGMLAIAGQVQAASGARVIEERVRKAEAANKDDPLYWLGRAHYFAGRKQHRDADDAFGQAWRRRTDRTAGRIVNDHARYRFQVGGIPAVLALLRARIAGAELDSPYAAGVVSQMLYYANDDSSFPKPTEELWWRYLKRRPVWGTGSEEGLFRRMAERVADTDRDAFWKRAEALAANTHPGRAKRIGWVMTGCGLHRRAIPLLRDAMRRLEREPERNSARSTCFDALLALRDWKNAEVLCSNLRSQEGPREVIGRYSRLALTAARAGARRDALRIWLTRTNLDRGDLRFIEEMAAAGLGRKLAALYRKLGATRALVRLGS